MILCSTWRYVSVIFTNRAGPTTPLHNRRKHQFTARRRIARGGCRKTRCLQQTRRECSKPRVVMRAGIREVGKDLLSKARKGSRQRPELPAESSKLIGSHGKFSPQSPLFKYHYKSSERQEIFLFQLCNRTVRLNPLDCDNFGLTANFHNNNQFCGRQNWYRQIFFHGTRHTAFPNCLACH